MTSRELVRLLEKNTFTNYDVKVFKTRCSFQSVSCNLQFVFISKCNFKTTFQNKRVWYQFSHLSARILENPHAQLSRSIIFKLPRGYFAFWLKIKDKNLFGAPPATAYDFALGWLKEQHVMPCCMELI